MESIEINSLLVPNLVPNNIQLQELENVPSDYVFSGSETVETFVVNGDLIFTLDEDNNVGWTQELVPEVVSINCCSENEHPLQSPGSANRKSGAQSSSDKKLTRKRRADPTKWKANIAKSKRQSGKPYTTNKGKKQPGKFVKDAGCSNKLTCPHKCMFKIDKDGRQTIYDSYWGLNDAEKRLFYTSNVKQVFCARKRTKAEKSQKGYTLNYYFNYQQIDIRVCQQFFTNTLNVNKGRVYYFFKQSKNRKTVTPGRHVHGKHTKKALSEARKQAVRDHINKFPIVESHYCRQSTQKQYLDQGLNLSQMYRLYSTESDNPLKLSAYRDIFNYEFNLSFFRPKKDRCDKCVEYELIPEPNEDQSTSYSLHYTKKTKAHTERNKDRNISQEVRVQNKSGVVDFDLENVFQLPIANASILFYLRKFGVYNLTVAINKVVYNVLWNEFTCGRAGTHLASALVKALKQIVLENPEKEHLTLWSDSCIPQNRNSYMSAAIQEFLNSSHSGNIQSIDHKYSEAGHGEVQDIDSAHSVIERFLRKKFIYSPVSLIKELRKIPTGKFKFVFIEMENSDYFDYQSLALASKYSVIPYKKLVQLTYKKHDSEISFKLDYTDDFITTDIMLKHKYITAPTLQELQLHSTVTAGKINDIQKMYGIMPEIDRKYYEDGFEKLMQKRPIESVTSATEEHLSIGNDDPTSNSSVDCDGDGDSTKQFVKSKKSKVSRGARQRSTNPKAANDSKIRLHIHINNPSASSSVECNGDGNLTKQFVNSKKSKVSKAARQSSANPKAADDPKIHLVIDTNDPIYNNLIDCNGDGDSSKQFVRSKKSKVSKVARRSSATPKAAGDLKIRLPIHNNPNTSSSVACNGDSNSAKQFVKTKNSKVSRAARRSSVNPKAADDPKIHLVIDTNDPNSNNSIVGNAAGASSTQIIDCPITANNNEMKLTAATEDHTVTDKQNNSGVKRYGMKMKRISKGGSTEHISKHFKLSHDHTTSDGHDVSVSSQTKSNGTSSAKNPDSPDDLWTNARKPRTAKTSTNVMPSRKVQTRSQISKAEKVPRHGKL